MIVFRITTGSSKEKLSITKNFITNEIKMLITIAINSELIWKVNGNAILIKSFCKFVNPEAVIVWSCLNNKLRKKLLKITEKTKTFKNLKIFLSFDTSYIILNTYLYIK